MARRVKKTDYANEEIRYDPEEKFDFDENLPFTGENNKRRKSLQKKDNRPPIGYGKYKDEINFEEGLPEFKFKVNIQKAAAENIETIVDENVPVKIHHSKSSADNVPVRIHSVKKKDKKSMSDKNDNGVIAKKIVRREDKYCVESEATGKSFGCYTTKDQAVARLKQIESFKKDNDETILPYVLTWKAVNEEFLPDIGVSGLPPTLEQDVPPNFRFWKCNNREDALLVREALVEEGIFKSDTIRVVNSEIRRAVLETVQKLYLAPVYDDLEPVVIPSYSKPIEKVAELLRPSEKEKTTVLFDENIVDIIGLETVLAKAEKIDGDYVVSVRDTEVSRKILQGPIFKLKSRDDLLFITNAELACERNIDWVQYDRSDELVKYAFSDGRVIRFVKAEEERTVYGIVLEPDEVDSQNDIISKEEIKQACYKFMEDYGNLGKQHQEIVNGSQLILLENFIAPIDFEFNNESVKKGSWIMKERVVDDGLWESIKKGEFTGYSIGGSGIRQAV
jgi:hypothetical protein